MRHGFCTHAFDFENISHSKVQKIALDKLIDKDICILRSVATTQDMVPKKYRDLVSKYKTYIIWFENPTFPLYPKVKFLDTATHCGVVGDAFVPALYEAFERYSILNIPQHMPYAESSYNDLIGNGLEALDPTEFWHYSEQQLSNNKLLKMELDSNLKWVKANSTNGKHILIPEDFVYINTLIPSSYANNTTSGCAAHNNEESSHLNAFLELIERDNTIRHWASFNSVDHINIESLPTYAITVANALDELGYDMLVLNSSLYQGITVLEILLFNKEDKFPKAIISSAAGLTPMKALGSALNEAMAGFQISMHIEAKRKPFVLNESNVITPEDHAAYYKNPEKFKLLSHYYRSHRNIDFSELVTSNFEFNNIYRHMEEKYNIRAFFYDVTPDIFKISQEKVIVSRCFSPDLVPLNFGTGNIPYKAKHLKLQLSERALIHPHPYA